MEILLLIGLNLPAVPFLHEAEHGARRSEGRSVWHAWRLREARRAFWFAPFCWAAALYLAGVMLAWRLQDLPLDPRVFLNLLLMQVLLWSAVGWSRSVRERGEGLGPRH